MANGNKAPSVRSVGTNLIAGAANTVYSCPVNHTAKVELIYIANTTSGNKTVTIKWHDNSTGLNYFIVGGYTVSAYDFLKINGSYFVLNSGDYLVITPEAGSIMDATISVEEYFDPANIN